MPNKKRHISYSQIIRIRDSLEIGSIDRLLLSMYTHIYPLGYNYYSTELIYSDNINSSSDYIYLSSDHAILHINQYTTPYISGRIHYRIPECLFNEINISLNKFPRRYLFTDVNNKPFTQSAFIKWIDTSLTRIFNNDISLPKLRYMTKTTIDLNQKPKMLFKTFDGFGKSLHVGKNDLYCGDGTFLDYYSKHYMLLLSLHEDIGEE